MADFVKNILINVSSNAEKAAKGLGSLKDVLGKTGKGIDTLGAKLMKLMKNPYVALIGALVAVFIKLRDAIKNSDNAGTAFARLGSQLKVVFEPIQKLINLIAEGLGKAANAAADFLNALMPDALKEDADRLNDIVVATDNLEEAERSYAIQHTYRMNEIARLNNIARDSEHRSVEERKAAIDQMIELNKEDIAERKRNLDEKIRIFKEERKNQQSWSDDDKNAYTELVTQRIGLDAEYSNVLTQMNRLLRSFADEQVKIWAKLSKDGPEGYIEKINEAVEKETANAVTMARSNIAEVGADVTQLSGKVTQTLEAYYRATLWQQERLLEEAQKKRKKGLLALADADEAAAESLAGAAFQLSNTLHFLRDQEEHLDKITDVGINILNRNLNIAKGTILGMEDVYKEYEKSLPRRTRELFGAPKLDREEWDKFISGLRTYLQNQKIINEAPETAEKRLNELAEKTAQEKAKIDINELERRKAVYEEKAALAQREIDMERQRINILVGEEEKFAKLKAEFDKQQIEREKQVYDYEIKIQKERKQATVDDRAANYELIRAWQQQIEKIKELKAIDIREYYVGVADIIRKSIPAWTTMTSTIDTIADSIRAADVQIEGIEADVQNTSDAFAKMTEVLNQMLDEDIAKMDTFTLSIKRFFVENQNNIGLIAQTAGDLATVMANIAATYQDSFNKILNSEEELTSHQQKMAYEAAESQYHAAVAQIILNEVMSLGNTMVAATSAASQAGIAAPVVFAATLASLMAGIATTLVSINQAKQGFDDQLEQIRKKSAGYATGGYVQGAGTGTSDSIPARLSNGESVINARSTARFYDLLSAINQAGGGAAFPNAQSNHHYAQGGVAQSSYPNMVEAIHMAVSDIQPVVSVREITHVQNRLKAKELI